MSSLTLTLLESSFTIHRLEPHADVPTVVLESPFFAVTRTDDELSIVVPEAVEIQSIQSDSSWACFKVEGPLDFGLLGILDGISAILAEAKISIFAVSTFETDYILVKGEHAEIAVEALTTAGYQIIKENQ